MCRFSPNFDIASPNRLHKILSKNIWKETPAHLSHNYYMCLDNVTVFFSPCTSRYKKKSGTKSTIDAKKIYFA